MFKKWNRLQLLSLNLKTKFFSFPAGIHNTFKDGYWLCSTLTEAQIQPNKRLYVFTIK